MASFRFLHAADLHLDSPLVGLRGRSETWATHVERASRSSFEGLLRLAQAQDCAFVVLAGDVFDGALRNYQTGLFFMAGMRTLGEAGIAVYVILGNHDAENQFARQLPLAKNVRVFAAEAPQSFRIEALSVSLHGQSFKQRDVTDNLARSYPPPVAHDFNIGVLHTACQGNQQHAPYAPCSVEQLVHHGYDYWALGHVHTRAVLHEHPHIVYPGNLQGRSPKETGGKGASIVSVQDGRITACTHHDLDVVRWEHISVAIGGIAHRPDIVEAVRDSLAGVTRIARDKPVALRLTLTGASPLHSALQVHLELLRQEVQTMFETVHANLWLERLRLDTEPMQSPRQGVDPTVSGALTRLIQTALDDGTAQALVETKLNDLINKMPAGADAAGLLARLRSEGVTHAAALAFALVDDRGSSDAPA